MNPSEVVEKWASKLDLRVNSPAPWQGRKIGPNWDCDFRIIEPKIIHIHLRFPKEATLTQWKRFFQERNTFLEEHGPKRPGWCEVWSRDGALPHFTLDERSLFLEFLSKSRGYLHRWYAVKASRLFKAQKELWEGTQIPLRFPLDLKSSLENALDVVKAVEVQILVAKGSRVLFQTETLQAHIGDIGKENRWVNLWGILHADSLRQLFDWTQDYFSRNNHLPHLWNDQHLGFSSTLTKNAYLKLLNDFCHLNSNISMVRRSYLSKEISVGQYTAEAREVEMENTIDLLRKDIEFLNQKNEKLELDLQKESIKSQEATSAKSEFLNVINHELKTPLNGVSGMVELLKSTELSPDQESFLAVAEQSTLRLTDLVNNLLEFSRIDSGEIELQNQEFEPNHLFKTLLEDEDENNKSEDIAYHFKGLAETFLLTGDIQRLQQVTRELLSNAKKNTQKGHISLSLSVLERKGGRVGLKVEVEDTGYGIPKDKVAQLFNEFTQVDMSTTRRISGSGLGLSLCRKLLGMMGGRMGLSSEVDAGSRFWFALPLETITNETKETTEDNSTLELWKGRHALVVEDNAISRRVLVKELGYLGFQVEVTGNGFAAIDLLRDQDFDLALLDLHMPECDGFQIAKEILEENGDENTPVFFGITREYNSDLNSRCLENGMVECISKPIALERILKALSRHRPPSFEHEG